MICAAIEAVIQWQPGFAIHITPPGRKKTVYLQYVLHFLISSLIIYIVTILSVVMGAISSVRLLWFVKQDIMKDYIKPSLRDVWQRPFHIGLSAGFVAYCVFLWTLPGIQGTVSGCLVAALVAFLGSRRRGLRIFRENIKRAGIVFIEDIIEELGPDALDE